MPAINAASVSILQLCHRHDIDPFSIVGLLALSALDRVDFENLRFWKNVAERLGDAREHAGVLSGFSDSASE